MLPRTWEDPARRGLNGTVGDNDPLDVMELGSRPFKVGELRQVRAEVWLLFCVHNSNLECLSWL